MSEDPSGIAQKIKKVFLKQDDGSSGIRTVECKSGNNELICELSHKIDENNKYLPILKIYNDEDNSYEIEIQNLEDNPVAKAVVDKILELRIPAIIYDGLIEAESMCYLMKSGDRNREIGYIIRTADACGKIITPELIRKRLIKQEKNNYAVGIVTANCHAGSMFLLVVGNGDEIYTFDTESSAGLDATHGLHREESRKNMEYAEPRGSIFWFWEG